MWCIRKLKVYFVLFYICGLTTYIPLNKNHKKALGIVSVFVRIFHISILLAIFVLFFINHFDQLQSNSFNEVFLIVVLLNGNIIASFVLYNSITSRDSTLDICARFASVVQRMDRNLQIKFQVNKFKLMFALKIVLKFATVVVLLFAYYTPSEDVNLTKHLQDKLYSISRIIVYVACFQVVFYIDLIWFSLLSINDQLEKQFYTSKRYTKTSTILYHLKYIHYNLWKISQIINQNYGSLTAVLLLQYFTLFVNTSFTVLTSRSSVDSMRK